ncbi:MAG: T9SS type A sorting domain-containing protein [Saprospiraceae bacterium]
MKTFSLLLLTFLSIQCVYGNEFACDNVTNPGLIYHPSNTPGLVKFCSAWQPIPISETQAASGGSGGALLYQWQYAFPSNNWQDIAIAEGADKNLNLGDPALISFFQNMGVSNQSSILFRRGVKRPDCTTFLYSNVLEYRVYPDVKDPNPMVQAGVFCDYSSDEQCFSVNTTLNPEVFDYLWDFSYDNENWIYSSNSLPESYCYPSGTTAYVRTASRLKDSPCDYQYNATLEIITQRTPVWQLDLTQVSCQGLHDGSVSISDESGNSTTLTDGYVYSINNGQSWQNSPSFSGLSEGNYSLKIKTVFCGTYTQNFTISTSPSPSLQGIDTVDESDCEAGDGEIVIELSGGTGSYQYRLSVTPWQSSAVFQGLSAGNYNVYGRNADGSCETFLSNITIDAPSPPIINAINHQDISDCNANDGLISIQASSGEGTLRYSINGGNSWSSNPTFSALGGGNYNAGVSNQNGTCAQFASVTLEEPDAPSIQTVNTSDPTDCDTNNGQISIVATSNGGSLQYSINNGQNWSANSNFNNLGPGLYQIKVRKTDGSCEVAYTSGVNLSPPSTPEVTAIEVEQPSDCNTDDGSISIYPSNSNFAYSIDGGQNWQEGSGIFQALGPGEYLPFIRNGDGTCATQAGNPILINYPNQPVIEAINYGAPSDWCLSDGYLSINASGGVGPLEYTRNGIQWSVSPNFSNLGTAQLIAGVRNANGSCETFFGEEISITYPERPQIDNITATPSTGCGADDGSITIEASGGIGAFDYAIDGGNTWFPTPVFTGLPSGNYDIAIRNKNGSCDVTDHIFIPELLKPRIVDIQIETPSDCGLADASISLTGDRGTGEYEYTVDGGDSWTAEATIDGLAPGTYLLGIRNANGFCEEFENESTTIAEHPHKVITDVAVVQPSDCDKDDGQITLTSQGNGTSEYSINNGNTWQSNRVFNNLPPGEYFPIVRNTDGTCLKPFGESFTLSYPPRPVYVDIETSPTSDCNVNDGSMTILLSNGIGTYQYSLNDGSTWQSSPTFTGLSATTYGKIAVRNSDGTCYEEYPSSVQITEPPKPVFGSTNIDQPSDCNLDDGTIQTNASQGIGSFEYSFDGGDSWQNASSINNLAPGAYLQGIRNADGTCEIFKNTPVSLDYPPSPSIANVSAEQPSDCGTNDGSISISAANGTGSFQFSIDGGNTWKNNGNFNNLAPGQFDVAVRNANGTCEILDNEQIELDYPPSPSIANVSAEQPSDCGTNDGSINISAANGTGAFQYSIDGGNTWKNNGIFNNLAPGQFDIAVRNANGTCEIPDNEQIELDYPPSPSIANVSAEQPSDCGTNDGSISISAANGTGSFQYSIDGGNSWKNSGNFNNLAPGQFDIAVRNANGTCEILDNAQIELDYPPSPSIANVSAGQPSDCGTNDGSISISAANGIGAFQFSIDGGNSWKNNGNFNNLAPGQFDIAVRNANGTCEIIDNEQIELDYPPSPSIANVSAEQPSDCGTNDGSISISAANGTGAFQFSIDGGNTWKNNGNFNNLAPGQFDVAVRNANGTCEIIDNEQIELDYPPSPSIANVSAEQPSDCGTNDGSISISAANGTGSFQFSIDGGNTWKNNGNFNNLAPGQFDVAVRNANGTCEIFDNEQIELDYPPSPSIVNVSAEQPSDCGTNDGSISISAANGTGAFQFSIDGGNTWKNNGIFNNLAPGQFDIAVRNANGTCEIIDNEQIELDYPPSPSIANVSAGQPSDCGTNDGSISISAANGTGSFQYSIDGGNSWKNSGNFNNLAPGQFDIAVRNANGTCEIIDNEQIELDYPPSPSIANVSAEQPSDCGTNDGSISISAANGTGAFQFSIDGGNTWKNNGNFNNLAPGQFDVAMRNANGTCEIFDNEQIELDYPPSPSITNVSAEQPSDCGTNDGSISISAANGTGAFQFSIDGGNSWKNNGIFNNLAPGQFDIAVRNANGTCEVLDNEQIELDYPPSPSIANVSAEQPSDCGTNDGSISISAANGTGAFQYSIDGGNTWKNNGNFNNLAPGQFDIAVRNANGTCEIIDNEQIELDYPPSPSIANVSAEQPSDCGTNDGSISISAANGTGVFQFSIDGGNTWKNNGNFNNLAPGQFDIAVRNANGTCEIFDNEQIELDYPPSPSIASVSAEQPSDCGANDGSIIISGQGGIGSYSFSINGGNNWQASTTFTSLAPGNYQVAIQNANGTCVTTGNSINLAYPESPNILNVNTQHPAGCGIADGSIQIQANGGEGVLAFSINNGNSWQNNPNFFGLGDGTYTISVKNEDETCPVSYGNVQLNGPESPIIANLSSTDPTDCGAADGTISIQANGGSGNFQYSINGGQNWQNNAIFNGLAEGNYSPAIRNSDGTCEVDYQSVIQLQEPEPAQIDAITPIQPSNCGLDNGQINIQVQGPSQNFEFSIDGGNNWSPNTTFSNLPPGIYQVGVRKKNGTCEVIYPNNILLNYPPAPQIQSVDFGEPSDCGLDNGQISILASGGIGNFEYSINGGQTWVANNTFNNLAPGAYHISVRNKDQSCPVDYNDIIEIDYPSGPNIQDVQTENPTDCGSSTGAIFIQLSESNGNFAYSINDGQSWSNSNIFNGLAEGNYQVKVRNTNGTCAVAYPATISLVDPSSPAIIAVDKNDPTNCEDHNGQINIIAEPGTGNLQYTIDGGQNWQNNALFSNLAPGSYQVRVRNANGSCVVNHNAITTLNAPTAPSFLSVDSESISDCGQTDGQIIIQATIGSGALSYSIDNGTNWQASNTFNNLPPGTYLLAIRNGDGSCEVSFSEPIQIDSPPLPEIVNITPSNVTDCGLDNGIIAIQAYVVSGNLLYSINGGETWRNNATFIDLAPGQYNVSIRNANGTCQVNAPQAITIGAPLAPSIIDIQVQQASSCEQPNGSILIVTNPSQGLQFSIDGGGTWSNNASFQNLAPGQYNVSIRNADGACQVNAPQPVTISAPLTPSILDIQVQQANACEQPNGSIVIVASPNQGVQYSIDGGGTWSNTSSFQNLAPGQYNVSIRNADGACQVNASQPVTISAPLTPSILDIQVQQASSCEQPNGSILVVANPSQGLQFSIDGGGSWSNNASFQDLAPGQYNISIRNADGACQVNAPQPVTISAPLAPSILDIQVQQASSCEQPNGSIFIVANPSQGLQFSIDGGGTWSNNASFQNLAPGQYNVSIRNADGACQVNAPQPVTISAPLTPSILDIQVQQANACEQPNGSIVIVASPNQGVQYSIDGGGTWSNTSSFQNLAPGQYNVSIRNADGACQVNASQPVTISAPLTPSILDIQVQQANTCEQPNGSIVIVASPNQGVQYSIDGGGTWSNTSSFQDLAPGQYNISIRNADGACQVNASQPVTISAPLAPSIIDIQVQQASSCEQPNGSIVIVASPNQGVQYSIDGGGTWSNTSSFQNLAPGQYNISIRNADGACQVNASQPVTISAPLAPSIIDIQVQQASSCEQPNGSIFIVANPSQGLQLSIDGGGNWSNNSSFQDLAPGQYNVSIRNADGACQVNAPQPVTISAPLAPSIIDIQLQQASSCEQPNGSIFIVANPSQGLQFSIDGGGNWSNNSSFQDLAPGQYNISIRNADGACQVNAPQPATISAPLAPSIIDIQVQQASSCEQPNGSILILANPSQGLQFSIDGGETWSNNASFQDLAPGQYNVSIRNADGACQVNAPQPITISAPLAPSIIDIQVQQASSCEQPNGSIFIVANPSQGLQFSIDGGGNWSNNSSFQDLAPGQYNVSIRNADGACQVNAPQPITISTPLAPSIIDIQVQQASSCEQPNGSIFIVANPSQGLQFSIDGGGNWSNNASFQDLAPGQYNISIRNADGACQVNAPQPVTISAPLAPSIIDIQVQQAGSCEQPNGSILIVANPSQGLQFSIDGGGTWSNNASFQNLTPGQYNISIRNADGACQVNAPQPITISAPLAPSIIDIQVQQASSCEQPNGSIFIAANPSQGLQFSIDGGGTWSNNASFQDLAPGQYNISIRNADGACQVNAPQPVTILAVEGWRVERVEVLNTSGCGASDGKVIIEMSDTSQAVLFSIDNGANWQASPRFEDLAEGIYQIILNDTLQNCAIPYGEVIIEGTPAPAIENVGIILPSSCTQGDGGIFINLVNDGDFKYSIDGGQAWQMSHQFDSLLPGTYFVKVSNSANTCMADYEIPVRLPANGAATIWSVFATPPTSCMENNGQIEILILEAEELFEFSIDNGQNWQDSPSFGQLASQDYQIIVRNKAEGCLSVYYTILHLPSAPNYENLFIQEQRPSTCGAMDGSIIVNYNAPEGSLFSIDGGEHWQASNRFDQLAGGIYELRIKMPNETCQIAHLNPINLVFSTSMPLDITIDQLSDCGSNDGRIVIQAPTAGNYNYSINRGFAYSNLPSFSNLSPGDYIVRIQDLDHHCEYEHPTIIHLDQLSMPSIDSVNIEQPAPCLQNGRIHILTQSSTNPLAYSIDGGENWAENDGVFGQLAAGNYQAAVRYANGSCFTPYNQAIVLNDTNQVSAITVHMEQTICEGSYFQVGDSSFYETGNYEIYLAHDNGCDSLVYLSLTLATPSQQEMTRTICQGDVQTIGTQTFSEAGDYHIILTSALGCDSIINLHLSVYQPDTSLFTVNLCEGEIFYFEDQSFDSTGIYSLTRPTAFGCDSTIIIDLHYTSSPKVVDILTTMPTNCESEDGQIALTTNSPLHLFSIDNGLRWQNTPRFQALGNGAYEVTIRDQQTNCIHQEVVELLSDAFPQIDTVLVDPGAICAGLNGSIQFIPREANANFLFSIDGGSQWQPNLSYDGLGAGNYSLFISREDTSCIYHYQSVYIQATDSLALGILTAVAPICENDSSGIINIRIHQGTPPFTYDWSNGSDLPEIDQIPAGHYSVTVTDGSHCKDSIAIYLAEGLGGIAVDSLLQDTFLLCKGQSLSLAPGIPEVTYKWWSANGFASEEPEVVIEQAGVYYLSISNASACVQTDSFVVIQSEDYLEANFLLPSVGLMNTSIFAIEVSWPVPERIQWFYDNDRIEQLSTYLNQEEFLFKEEGTYTLKMAAQLGTCVQYVEKLIQIYSDPDSIPVQTGPNGFNEILDFSLFPNPTDGPFEVIAEFEEIQTAQVRIYRDTGLLVESRNLNGLKRYREAFQLQDVPSGHYIAVLQTPTEYRTLNFIIQH